MAVMRSRFARSLLRQVPTISAAAALVVAATTLFSTTFGAFTLEASSAREKMLDRQLTACEEWMNDSGSPQLYADLVSATWRVDELPNLNRRESDLDRLTLLFPKGMEDKAKVWQSDIRPYLATGPRGQMTEPSPARSATAAEAARIDQLVKDGEAVTSECVSYVHTYASLH
jgi:hypothetical protein